MKIGKRVMGFWSFLLWVGALAIWFGGPFLLIKGTHYKEVTEQMEWDLVGLLLLFALGGALAIFLLFQALASPPGQFRNLVFAVVVVGMIAGFAEFVEFVQNFTGDLRGTLLDIAMIITGGYVANGASLYLDKGVS